MGYRDIVHNSQVIRALRELERHGIYGKLYKVRQNYGVILFDVVATGNYIMKEMKRKYVTSSYDQTNRTITFHIEIPEYEAKGEPKELRDETAKDLQDRLRRKGITSYVEIPDDRNAYVVIDLDSVAKYMAKHVSRALRGNVNAYVYYDRENAVVQAHVWTGETPEEVKRLKGGEA